MDRRGRRHRGHPPRREARHRGGCLCRRGRHDRERAGLGSLTDMDLVLGQPPAAAAANSAGAAADSATQAAASAAQAAASAAAIGFTAGTSVINDAGRLAIAMPIKIVAANYTIAATDRGYLLAATGSPIN